MPSSSTWQTRRLRGQPPRRLHPCCQLVTLLVLLSSCHFRPSSAAAAASSRGAASVSCQSCVYYAKIRVPISSESCVSGGPVASVDCQPGFACKVAFLQDSKNATVYASRGCERTSAFSGTPVGMTVLQNARTTMYCTGFGCNNNWAGQAAVQQQRQQQPQQPLHCWVGYGRHIDQFRLEQCSEAVLRLALRKNATGGGGGGGAQTAVCMLAQFARQIDYAGGVFESAAYMGQCAPHAAAVYGQNYPMFEYERTCLAPGCNADGIGAAGRIDVGVLMPAATAAGAAAGTAVPPTAAALLLLLMATVLSRSSCTSFQTPRLSV